jgi:hypothetical protein
MEAMMRLIMFVLVGSLGLVATVAAEEHTTALPEIVIGGPTNAPTNRTNGPTNQPAAVDSCVEVEIGSSRANNCINQKLKREVDRVNPSMNVPPISAASPDLKTGVVNIPGVQQQYGKNFGNSVVPYRPPPPIFAPSLGARH